MVEGSDFWCGGRSLRHAKESRHLIGRWPIEKELLKELGASFDRF